MSLLSPRLQLKVAQKQILTPGLVQMVTVLQLNRLELKEMINQEIVNNPVLEESLDGGEEISAEELQPLLETERSAENADREMLEAADIKLQADAPEIVASDASFAAAEAASEPTGEAALIDAALGDAETSDNTTADPFDEIYLGWFFDEYLDTGSE